MNDYFMHERLFRDISKHEQKVITICGAGAIGGNLSILLAQQGFLNLRIIDKDRVVDRNIGTQPFTQPDINSYKAEALRKFLYKKCNARVEPYIKELTYETAPALLRNSDLVIDSFDNSKSRKIVQEVCIELDLPCIHAGMSSDGFSEIAWNEHYIVPNDSGMDLCEYPMALNLIMMTVALTSETIIAYVHDGKRYNYQFTLGDFKVRKY